VRPPPSVLFPEDVEQFAESYASSFFRRSIVAKLPVERANREATAPPSPVDRYVSDICSTRSVSRRRISVRMACTREDRDHIRFRRPQGCYERCRYARVAGTDAETIAIASDARSQLGEAVQKRLDRTGHRITSSLGGRSPSASCGVSTPL